MRNLPKRALSLTAIAAGLCCAHATAQTTADPQQLQRVEVTGSNIKRLGAQTASPVQVYTRTDIQQTGANTVRQVLDTITSTTTNELRDDGSTTSFAAGASGVSLRGLGKAATLVLVNGRRIANYALADGAQITFTNIDSIPADIIERIEILKDGASAIYGSDAMAGVINIITRSNYEGVGVSASYQTGTSPNIGKQSTAGVVAGFGNLEKDRFNVLANLELYKREGYFLSDVKNYYPAWHKQFVNPAFGDPSLISWPGNFINGTTRVANPACPAAQRNSAGACTLDVNGLNQFSDPSKRVNLYSQARLLISNSLEGFAELSYSKTTTDYLALPFAINAPGTPYKWFDGNTKTVQILPKPLIPTSNPLNTFGKPVGLEYRFIDNLGMWGTPSDATQYRAMAGLKGTFAGWDWETALGRVAADASKLGKGAERTGFINAITSGEYKIGGTNSQELLDRMFQTTEIKGHNAQNFVDAKASGEIFKLPAGAVQMAVGVEHRDETVNIKSSDNVYNAQIIGNGALRVQAARKLDAAYAELEAPLLKGLVANGALRFDKASGFSGHVSPKLGLRYEVSPQLLLRGTAAGGFRAPNIPETLGQIGVTGFFNNTLDPKRCDTATKIRDILKTGNASDQQDATTVYNSGCLVSVPAMISANPKLKPELSKSVTLGFVFEPVKDLSIAVDYFKIERTDEISYRAPDFVLAREDQPAYASYITRIPVSAQDMAYAARANVLKPGSNLSWAAGDLVTLLLSYENLGKTQSSGIDFDVKGRVGNAEFGNLNIGFNATYALTMREYDVDTNSYRPNRVGLRNAPRLKFVLSTAWSKGDWGTGVRLTYTSATALNNNETDIATWAEANCAARLKPGELACFRDSDLRADLNVRYSGFKSTVLRLDIGNVTGEQFPVDLRNGYSVRPRTFKVSAEYKF